MGEKSNGRQEKGKIGKLLEITSEKFEFNTVTMYGSPIYGLFQEKPYKTRWKIS